VEGRIKRLGKEPYLSFFLFSGKVVATMVEVYSLQGSNERFTKRPLNAKDNIDRILRKPSVRVTCK